MAFLKCILQKISSLTSKFFYHGGLDKRLHLISWARTTLPRPKGGTGLSSAHTLNAIFKFKMVWRILNSASPLASWLKRKYGSFSNPTMQFSSIFWKELCTYFNKMKDKLMFKVGRGNSFSVLYDPWCNGHSVWNLLGRQSFEIFGSEPLTTTLEGVLGGCRLF